ncbi:hypothetical protein CsSME_00014000 [Camellia sinensis var. sinensis]
MIMPEKNRKEICKYLFQEGVCEAKKDFNLAKQLEIDVPNLQVRKLMQSFKSKKYVRQRTVFCNIREVEGGEVEVVVVKEDVVGEPEEGR